MPPDIIVHLSGGTCGKQWQRRPDPRRGPAAAALYWCGKWDLNPQPVKGQILSLVRLPIPPSPRVCPDPGAVRE